jgi:hypothetical protein
MTVASGRVAFTYWDALGLAAATVATSFVIWDARFVDKTAAISFCMRFLTVNVLHSGEGYGVIRREGRAPLRGSRLAPTSPFAATSALLDPSHLYVIGSACSPSVGTPFSATTQPSGFTAKKMHTESHWTGMVML